MKVSSLMVYHFHAKLSKVTYPPMKQKTASFIYSALGIVSILLGLIYLFSPEFMSYHREAVGIDWTELPPAFQVLILALIKVTGAGWVSMGIALLILLHFAFNRGQVWAGWAIPLIGLIFYGPTLYVTTWVTLNTPGTAPWYGSLIAVIMLLGGFILYPVNPFSIPQKQRHENDL